MRVINSVIKLVKKTIREFFEKVNLKKDIKLTISKKRVARLSIIIN